LVYESEPISGGGLETDVKLIYIWVANPMEEGISTKDRFVEASARF
jgi:hypothetical protein